MLEHPVTYEIIVNFKNTTFAVWLWLKLTNKKWISFFIFVLHFIKWNVKNSFLVQINYTYSKMPLGSDIGARSILISRNLYQRKKSLLILSDPGGPFCHTLSKSITNLLWMGILISLPHGCSSWRYLHCLLRSKIFLVTKIF